MLVDLEQYFSDHDGSGVLATANRQGRVNVAVYARPHILEEGSAGFIMPERLTWANLQANPQAAYLFQESGSQGKGLRLYLSLEQMDDDPQLISQLRRSHHGSETEKRHLAIFRIDKVLPLVGDGQ